MTRDFEGSQDQAGAVDLLILPNEKVRIHRLDLPPQSQSFEELRSVSIGKPSRMIGHATAMLALDPRRVGDVIDMPMGEEQAA